MQANMQEVQMKIKVKKSHHHILKMNHKPLSMKVFSKALSILLKAYNNIQIIYTPIMINNSQVIKLSSIPNNSYLQNSI